MSGHARSWGPLGSQAQGGVRGLGDLDPSSDEEADDGQQGNELYTGGAKRWWLQPDL